MYKVKPVSEHVTLENLPSTMYKVKPYVQSIQSSSSSSSSNLNSKDIDELNKILSVQIRRLDRLCLKTNELCEDLHLDGLVIHKDDKKKPELIDHDKLVELDKKQTTLLKRIHVLGNKVNELCDELKLTDLIQNFGELKLSTKPIAPPRKAIDFSQFNNIKRQTTRIETKTMEDFAIHIDPRKDNFYHIFSFFDLLSQKAKSFIQFYKHNSIQVELKTNTSLSNRLESYNELFEGLKLGLHDARSKYDVGLSIVWRASEATDEPFLGATSSERVHGQDKLIEAINARLSPNARIDLNKSKSDTSLSKLIRTF